MYPEYIEKIMAKAIEGSIYKTHDNQHVAFKVLFVNTDDAKPRMVKTAEATSMPTNEEYVQQMGVTKEELLQYFVSGPCVAVWPEYSRVGLLVSVDFDGANAYVTNGSEIVKVLAIDTVYAD